MVLERFPASLTGFMQPPFNLVYKSKNKGLYLHKELAQLRVWLRDILKAHPELCKMMRLYSIRIGFYNQYQFSSKGSSSFRDNKGEFSKGKEKVSDSKGKLVVPLDKEILNDLHRKKLCFFLKGPYEFGHDYPMRPKKKANHVMWAYYEGSYLENLEHHDEDPDEIEGEQEVDSANKKEVAQLHL